MRVFCCGAKNTKLMLRARVLGHNNVKLAYVCQIIKRKSRMVNFSDYNHHWSYYLAIEDQLDNSSRYVEFANSNLNTYSIEFARILLSAASEADVVLRQFCKALEPSTKADSINQYQQLICKYCPELIAENVLMSRFGMTLTPWENWNSSNTPPDWWTGNNKVKHHRHTHFTGANLKNAINSVGALHILIVYFYKRLFENVSGKKVMFGEVTDALQPKGSLLSLNNAYYTRYRIMHHTH